MRLRRDFDEERGSVLASESQDVVTTAGRAAGGRGSGTAIKIVFFFILMVRCGAQNWTGLREHVTSLEFPLILRLPFPWS
jgi:hypothetical protein